MVSRCLWKSQLCYQSLQGRYHLWTFSIGDPSGYPWWTPYPIGDLLSKIQCTYWKKYPFYAIHLPWSHECYQPYLMPCVFPIITSLPRDKAPHMIPLWMPTPYHNLSHCTIFHYHLWPPSRYFPRIIPLSKYIQWPSFFFRCRRRPRPKWQTLHSLCHPLYFWSCCTLDIQNTTSICSLFHRLRSPQLLPSHQNGPTSPTHPLKPWLPSLWCSNS